MKARIGARAKSNASAHVEPEALIGRRIRAARERASKSMSELHRATGISRAVLRNYEIGKYKPGARELRRLCDALRVSPNELIYGSADPFRPADPFALVESTEFNEETLRGILPPLLRTMLLVLMLPRNDRESLLGLSESLCSRIHGTETLGRIDNAAKAISAALSSQIRNLEHVFALAILDPAFQALQGAPGTQSPDQVPVAAGKTRKRTTARRAQ